MYYLIGQETFTKILLLPVHQIVNCWSLKHEKTASRVVYVGTFSPKNQFTKAEPKTMVAPALAHKSSDWITLG